MIRFVYDQSDDIIAFVAREVGMSMKAWPGSKTIGVMNDQGQFLGGVIYHHWDPKSGTIVMSGASATKRWLTRAVIQRIFDYPFKECGCQLLLIQLSERDWQLQRQLKAIGFKFTVLERLFGRDHDGVVARLTDDAWAASPFNRGEDRIEEAA